MPILSLEKRREGEGHLTQHRLHGTENRSGLLSPVHRGTEGTRTPAGDGSGDNWLPCAGVVRFYIHVQSESYMPLVPLVRISNSAANVRKSAGEHCQCPIPALPGAQVGPPWAVHVHAEQERAPEVGELLKWFIMVTLAVALGTEKEAWQQFLQERNKYCGISFYY